MFVWKCETHSRVFLSCLWRFSWSGTVCGSYAAALVRHSSCILLWASPISRFSWSNSASLPGALCCCHILGWVEGPTSPLAGSYLKTLYFLCLTLHMFSNDLVCLQKEILWKTWDLALCIFPHRPRIHLGMFTCVFHYLDCGGGVSHFHVQC